MEYGPWQWHTKQAHWLSLNAGHISRHSWTKIHQFSMQCICVPQISHQAAKLSNLWPKFWCFWATNLFAEEPQISGANLQIRVTNDMLQNLVTIDRVTLEIRCWETRNKWLQHYIMACTQPSWRMAIKMVIMYTVHYKWNCIFHCAAACI